jgi:hypothetical protein
LDAVALVLKVDGDGLSKVALTRALVEQVGQPWDASCSSEGTESGGGGNITATALRRILTGITAAASPAELALGELALPPWADSFVEVADWLEVEGHLETQTLEDERWRLFSALAQRRGVSGFRERLIVAYEGRCAITGCDVVPALEAAHLVPHLGSRTHSLTNGIPLRSDLHVLFDLGLLGFDPGLRTVRLVPELHSSTLGDLHGRELREPRSSSDRPSDSALLWRAENVGPSTDF